MRLFLTLLVTPLMILHPLVHGHADDKSALPDGITNSQRPTDIPLSPLESLKRMTVPEGFRVSLFAAETRYRATHRVHVR